MSTAIEFNHIGKQYRLGLVSTGTLSHDLNRWWQTSVLHREDPYLKIGSVNDRTKAADSDYVWALRDIDFRVEQGDVVGIIGKNGAGKSTLLKLLSKVTAPTVGTIRARGRIASLLEVGTGFHGEMTGRENIYLNGAIMGMTRQEITRKLDEIVDFSGCERYLDTPVKRYSSGMTVRLGFAVAAHLDPEILVVDEVLAVGDAEFQKKAIGKMQDISHSHGRTVLFVSHNMGAVRSLCKRGIVLDKGLLVYAGEVNDAVDWYTENSICHEIHPYVEVSNKLRDMNRSLDVQFRTFEMLKESGTYATDEDIVLHITIEAFKDVPNCRINYTIFSAAGAPIANHSSNHLFSVRKGEIKSLEYTIVNPHLAIGDYTMSFSVGTGNMLEGETNYDVVPHILSFSIDRFKKEEEAYFAKWNKGWWGSICAVARIKELL